MKKWRVVKRDGVWAVLDRAGKLRYAASEHRMALSFALTQGPKYKLATAVDAASITKCINDRHPDLDQYFKLTAEEWERIQRAIEKLFGTRDEDTA